MEQNLIFKIDLREIGGEGDFSCPSCGNMISPDDSSDESYEISEIKTRKDGSLKEIIVICNRCSRNIKLEGFDLLRNL
jgi:hypothetical protein